MCELQVSKEDNLAHVNLATADSAFLDWLAEGELRDDDDDELKSSSRNSPSASQSRNAQSVVAKITCAKLSLFDTCNSHTSQAQSQWSMSCPKAKPGTDCGGL